ncbi:Uncharacterised protein [Mycobacteroides abscessus subsp. abscessus]|nr:Uncharacterised protein [Mycobacteroides abscessus subsp. abscessus]SKV18969.1 Uncharacterised protein [Mycobacteroides abscessus subsp. abscessus]
MIQPRRPTRTSTAGRKVTDATKAIRIDTLSAGPTVDRMPNLVNPMPRKVTATVAAEAATTLPMDSSAAATASSEARPCLMYS